MTNHRLNIGDVVTSSEKVIYTCLGLGSCIGLFIKDRLTNQTAGAHIFLPDDEQGPDNISSLCNVSAALDEILRQLKMNGSNLTALRAKMAGGANVLGTKTLSGYRNAQSVLKQLIRRGIYIAASDLGGTHCRSATFDSNSGTMTVKNAQLNEFKTF